MEFIAELGTCWDGDFIRLSLLVNQCKKLGFNAVKFQAFGKEHYERHLDYPHLRQCSITEYNIERIDEICKYEKIEWYATPTNVNAIGYLNDYVKRFKVRFKDRFNIHILEAIRKTHKPYYVSTDMHRNLAENKYDLYCVPKYPTKLNEIDFHEMSKCYGYSNHCKDMRAIIGAVEQGAQMVEIHVTPSHQIRTIDDAVSFDPIELQTLFNQLEVVQSYPHAL